MRALGSGDGAVRTAEALGVELDDSPSPDEANYVLVLEGPGAWAGYQSFVKMGVLPIAIVAWGVPSVVLARLAASSPPIVVGLPDAWQLQAALERGNSPEMISTLERQARIEGYLATNGAHRREGEGD